ncbi:MAG: hypothetical protein JWN34_677, partial [Bryobacterales bacterium]|nr:hypothetical protein [Bryobacterales bacterium]
MRPDQPDEPWLSFLNELDGMLSEPTELHCIGGFAVVHAYGSDRTTTDLDILLPAVVANGARLIEAAGKASALKTRYGVHLE